MFQLFNSTSRRIHLVFVLITSSSGPKGGLCHFVKEKNARIHLVKELESTIFKESKCSVIVFLLWSFRCIFCGRVFSLITAIEVMNLTLFYVKCQMLALCCLVVKA